MVSPLHQILTDRSINGVQFQRGWLPCAAANVGTSYDVAELDPALESRFLTIVVVACVVSWVEWGRREKLDRRVLDFVGSTPSIFESSSPRSWTHVARLMREADAVSPPLLEALVAGAVGDALAPAFLSYASSVAETLRPEAILGGSTRVIDRLREWRQHGNVALLTGSARLLQAHLQTQTIHDRLTREERRNIVAFVKGLPAEVRTQWNVWATKCGYQTLIVSKGRVA